MPRGVYPRRHRAKKSYPEPFINEVRELYDNGLTQKEIAIRLGSTQKVIWRAMLHHNIAARAPKVRSHIRGPLHPHWKGDAAGYQAFHMRLYALLGAPQQCARCGTSDTSRTYDWANLSGRYADMDDYARMCRQCHRRYDQARRLAA
jgi:hypothetical protein